MVVFTEEMSRRGTGKGERGRMVQRSETCIKRPKPLENMSGRSERLESRDALGRGEIGG